MYSPLAILSACLLGSSQAIKVNFAGSFVQSDPYITLSAAGPASDPVTGDDGLTVSLDAFPSKSRLKNRNLQGPFFVDRSVTDVPDWKNSLVRFDMVMSDLSDMQIANEVQQGIDITVSGFLPETDYECTLYWASGLFDDGRQFDILLDDEILFGTFMPDTFCNPPELCPFTIEIPAQAEPETAKITLNSRSNKLGPQCSFMICDVMEMPGSDMSDELAPSIPLEVTLEMELE